MTSLEGVEDVVSDAFRLVNQEPGRTGVLIMDTLDKAGDIAGAAEQKAAGRCAHLAFQPLPAGKEPMLPEPLETGKKLVGHLQPRGGHVHEARSWEIVERPQSTDRKNNAGFSRVVGAGGRGGLASFVTKQDPTLPVVKVGEPEAVGELQNGDKLRHVFRESR
jgi:hypothetical protein